MYGEPAPKDLDIQWWQTDVVNVGVLHCRTPGKPSIFVKLFAPKRSAYALHEATLLADPPNGLPSPQWIGATQVRGFHCHVLQVAEELPIRQGDTAKGVEEIRQALLQVPPPQSLLTRYQRSRPMLWQRVNDSMLERLRIAASDSQALSALAQLRARLQDWRDQLAALPLAITTRDVRPGNIVMTEAGAPTLLHWGSWAIEPAGAGSPTKPEQLQILEEHAAASALAALSHELESLIDHQRFSPAVALAPRLVGLLARPFEPSANEGLRE